jgi:nicotinamide-nucleotide amidase
MDIELLTVGTELLLGFSIDTNGAELGRELATCGVRVVRRTSVADDGAAIRDAIEGALLRTGAVLATGGLGPTRDDVTRDAVSQLLDVPLEFDPGVWAALEERFRRLGRPTPAANRAQAMVPRGGMVLPNQWGTAPGLWLESPRGLVILLPGVPTEMRNLLRHEVLPRLAARATGRVIRSRTVRTTSIAESALAGRLGDVEGELDPLTLAYLPGLEGVDLRLTAWDLEPDVAEALLASAAARLRAAAGNHVYAEDTSTLAEAVVHELRDRGASLAVAESCTGGLLGGRITEVAGSSTVFAGGIIAYADAVKVRELGVPADVIQRWGAVSEPVALAMAEGARHRFGTTHGVAITGVAGPGGGSEEKPVGTVWLAHAHPGEATAQRIIFPGSRGDVRARSVQAALFQVLCHIRGRGGS